MSRKLRARWHSSADGGSGTRIAVRQVDADLLLLAVARSAPADAAAELPLGGPTHDDELDTAHQSELWGKVGIEWDVGPSSLCEQLVNA
jgi:hypothetical protein